MAEARSDEDEDNMRREAREQVLRRQSDGRPGRRKPENRLSQGPLWSLRAAIKRTTSRSSLSDQPRNRTREGDSRRPEITVLSAEPLPSTSWLAGAPGAFPPPPPPAAQIWGATIPPSIQPPPSYEEVIREKTQEQGGNSPSAVPSPLSSVLANRLTIATQTDTRSSSAVPGGIKPQESAIPASRANGQIASALTPAPESDGTARLPRAHELECPRPHPRPRSRLPVNPAGNEVRVQTLVKLREDGLATLAARARSDASRKEACGGKYLRELLEAFSSDDWGFPECQGDDSGLSQSEEEEEEEEDEEMATLRARIRAFEKQEEKQEAELDGSGRDTDIDEDPLAKTPEPRPRPRLQVQPAKAHPPTLAPKPKGLAKSSPTDGIPPEHPKAGPVSEPPLSARHPSTAPTPVPAPRVPPAKTSPCPDETPTKIPARPTIIPRSGVGTPPPVKATSAKHITPSRPPRPSVEVGGGASTQTHETINLTGPSPEPNPAPFEAPAPDPGAVQAKAAPLGLRKAERLSVPPLPPRPSGAKLLPPRPPAIKPAPARPPPPGVVSPAGHPRLRTPLSLTGANNRASKRGPPLPPRPQPGHPLFHGNAKREVLIVLDEPPPETPATSVTAPSSGCLMDLDVFPPARLDRPGEETYEQNPPELPPVSGPRRVALYDFEGAQDDELTFFQGDAIGLLEVVDRQWGRGQLGGRVGLFPLSFTQATEEGPLQVSVAQMPSKGTQVEEWDSAMFDFAGQTAEDLPFHKGAHIQVIEHVDSQWRRGRLDGREGLYPVAFTRACQAQPLASQKAAASVSAKALFAFTAQHEDELTVKPGDIITQVESRDEQWIVGVVDGKRGMVPKNYIGLR
ncbi:uncharacterized protein LOC144065383 [Stigmatopora argus]